MRRHERERLLGRIRQLRRPASSAEAPPAGASSDLENDVIRALEKRVAHLEQLVQGLQDSVHRESLRHGRRIAELEALTQPAELTKALSRDARERGL